MNIKKVIGWILFAVAMAAVLAAGFFMWLDIAGLKNLLIGMGTSVVLVLMALLAGNLLDNED